MSQYRPDYFGDIDDIRRIWDFPTWYSGWYKYHDSDVVLPCHLGENDVSNSYIRNRYPGGRNILDQYSRWHMSRFPDSQPHSVHSTSWGSVNSDDWKTAGGGEGWSKWEGMCFFNILLTSDHLTHWRQSTVL